jgi:hypothetical protein
MGEGATGQAVMPQMLTAEQEGKHLAGWALRELASLRRGLDGAWELGVTAAGHVSTAWRADSAGAPVTARDPRDLWGLIAASEEGRAAAAAS